MIALVFASLTCCGITTEEFDASIEITPTELRLVDVVFARIWLTNKGKEPAILKRNRYSRVTGDLRLKLTDERRQTSFTLMPDGFGHIVGGSGGFQIEPGEKWLVGYELLKMPPPKCVEWPFWDPQKLSKSPYVVWGWLTLRRGVNVQVGTPKVTIRPRPETEMTTLLELCRDRREAWRNLPADFDTDRPTINWFGFTRAPPECSTTENLAILEKALSPGSLRDIVHLTRLTQAIYDEKDIEKRRKNLATLCTWLETLPEIERNWMSMQLIGLAIANGKGFGTFCFEVATEVALRLQAGDRDPNVRRFHEQAGKRSISALPLSAPYLMDFDKRLNAVEKRMEIRERKTGQN